MPRTITTTLAVVKCGMIPSTSPLSWGNHRIAKRKSPRQSVYAHVSPLGSPFALDDPVPSPIPMLLKWVGHEPAEADQFVPVSHPAFPWSLAPQQVGIPTLYQCRAQESLVYLAPPTSSMTESPRPSTNSGVDIISQAYITNVSRTPESVEMEY